MKQKNLGDWAVALVVVACSVVLFLALTFALSGTFLGLPGRTLRANFHDVTGINPSANVKYGGARAGTVVEIRTLTPEERRATGDPANLVQVTIALHKNIPALPGDVEVSVAADTLLSDKFISITGGSLDAAPLDANALVQGVTPVTFDRLVRSLDGITTSINRVMGGSSLVKGEVGGLVGQLRSTLGGIDGLMGEVRPVLTDARSVVGDAQTLVTEARGLVGNGGVLVTDASGLVNTNKDGIASTVRDLNQAATSLDKLAVRVNTLVSSNEARLNATLADIRNASANLKVTSTYAVILTKSLSRNPQRLLWGGRVPELPSVGEIRGSPVPLPPE